jgi:hypothetical protein
MAKRFQGTQTMAEGDDFRLIRTGHPEHPQGVYCLTVYGEHYEDRTSFHSTSWAEAAQTLTEYLLITDAERDA